MVVINLRLSRSFWYNSYYKANPFQRGIHRKVLWLRFSNLTQCTEKPFTVYESSVFRTLKLCVFQLDVILLKVFLSFPQLDIHRHSTGIVFSVFICSISFRQLLIGFLRIISLTFSHNSCRVFIFQMLHLSFKAPVYLFLLYLLYVRQFCRSRGEAVAGFLQLWARQCVTSGSWLARTAVAVII